MDRPREVPFHESANRPQLLMGGDRELILVSAILAAMLVFAVMKWWSILGGLVLWLIAVGVLARMAKVDPLLRHVYIRHIGYRDFYPAKSRMSAPPTTTPAIGDRPCLLLNSAVTRLDWLTFFSTTP